MLGIVEINGHYYQVESAEIIEIGSYMCQILETVDKTVIFIENTKIVIDRRMTFNETIDYIESFLDTDDNAFDSVFVPF